MLSNVTEKNVMRIWCFETMEKPVAGRLSSMFKFPWEMLFFESKDTEVFKADRNKLFASNEKQTDNHTLMLDMLHSNMSVVCTYHCRGIFHEKYFLVWLLFFVDLCSQKKLVKALNFNFYVHRAPPRWWKKTIDWCLPGSCTHHNYIFKQYSTYIKLITWCL